VKTAVIEREQQQGATFSLLDCRNRGTGKCVDVSMIWNNVSPPIMLTPGGDGGRKWCRAPSPSPLRRVVIFHVRGRRLGAAST